MNTTEETPAKASRFGRTAKFSLAGTVGAAALGIGAIVALPALTASPAYAVEETEDGNIRIEVNSPEDAAGLEKTLADHGIKAKVDFPENGYECDPDRYTEADIDGQGDYAEMSSKSLAFSVDPADFPLDGDTTLIVEIGQGNFSDDQGAVASLAILAAEGEVGDCDPVEIDTDGEEIDDIPEDGEVEADEPQPGEKGGDKDDDGSKDKD